MRFNRRSIVLFFMTFCVAFFAASYVAPNPDVLIVIRSFQAAAAYAVAIRYWPWAVDAWRANFIKRSQVYAFSIELLAQAIGHNAMWLWWWRSADEPRWMVDSPVNGFFVLMVMVAFTGKLAAPEVREPHMPRNPEGAKRVTLYIIGTLVFSIVLSVIGLMNEPKAKRFADWVRPYLAGDGTEWMR